MILFKKISSILFLFISVTFAQDSTNLLGHWDFNHSSGDTVYDKSGNGYHGIINGEANFVVDASDVTNGDTTQALNFDGINDFVQTELYLNTLPITIQVRFKALKNEGEQSLVDTDVGGQHGNSIILGYGDGDNTIDVQYNDGWYNSPRTYKMERWYTAVAIYEQDSISLFVNGNYVGSKTFVQGNLNGSKARFGRHNAGDPQWFKGLIDEVKIWNSVETSGLSQLANLPPAEPQNLTADNIRLGEVRLNWTPSTENDIAGYYIVANESNSNNSIEKRPSNLSWAGSHFTPSIYEAESIKDDSVTLQVDSLDLHQVEIGYVDVHPNGKGTIKFTYLDDTEDIFEFYGNGSINFTKESSRINKYEVVKTSGGNNPFEDRNNLKIYTLTRGLKSILIGDDEYREWQGLVKVKVSSLPQLSTFLFTELKNSTEYTFTVAAYDTEDQISSQALTALRTLSFLSNIELPMSDRVVAYYPLDGNTDDISGNNNHGKIEGEVLPTTGRGGRINTAYYFNGKSGSRIISDRELSLADSSHTISVWVKPESQTFSNNRHMFAHGTANQNNGLHTRFQTGPTIRYGFWNNDLDVVNLDPQYDWQNFVFTFDNISKKRKVFKDGILLGEDVSNASYAGVGKFVIGSHVPNYGNTESWLGFIDDVIIWDTNLPDSVIVGYGKKVNPVVLDLPDIAILEDSSASFDLKEMYSDTISYTISSNKDVINISIDSSVVTLSPKKDWFGSVDLTLSADNYVFIKGEVLAFHPAHQSGGYGGNFFGISDTTYNQNKHLFSKGAKLSLYSSSLNKFADFLVDYVTGVMSYEGVKTDIRYVYIQTPQYSSPPCNTCPNSLNESFGASIQVGDTWSLNREFNGVRAYTSFTVVVNPVQDAPSSFSWTSSKVDTVLINQENIKDFYKFEWSESIDVDDEIISYQIHSKVGSFSPQTIFDSTSTSFLLSYEDLINYAFNFTPGNSATLSFKIYATDGIDTVLASNEDRTLFINRYEFLSTENKNTPEVFSLHENYPNPFNPSTQIRFDLPESSDAVVTIYNALGQKVKVFNMPNKAAGYHALTWNGTNEYGDKVSAGVYLYQLNTNEFVKTRKMILLK